MLNNPIDEEPALAAATVDVIRDLMLYVLFDRDGNVIKANDNYLRALGHDVDTTDRLTHRQSLFPEYAESDRYREFWEGLLAGIPHSNRVSRFGPTGKRVWIEASYLPIPDAEGQVTHITFLGTDITSAMMQELEVRGKMLAIDNTLAVVEFTPDGLILAANQNFCDLMGYDEMDLVAEDHRMFTPEPIMTDDEYAQFWADLGNGKMFVGEVERATKSGAVVHLAASHNPIYDAHGALEKVVKFASDVTGRKNALDAIGRSLRLVRSGNLEASITTEFELSLEPLRNDFNEMVAELKTLVNGISHQAEGVNDDAGVLAGTAADLSRRAEHQAKTLKQASETMDGISTKINETASNSETGTDLARAASGQAETGRQKIDEVIAAMISIEEVTREINKITGLIDAIALQSRLLGLNAAVEAARAGDAGKGFNVVAAEVRSLAQKTADAAKEIGVLVSTTNQRVQNGVAMVRESGTTISQIRDAVNTLNLRIADIARACTEQADAVKNVTRDIGELDSITQKNSMVAEQSAATSAALRAKSGDLMDRIGVFKGSGATAPGGLAASAR